MNNDLNKMLKLYDDPIVDKELRSLSKEFISTYWLCDNDLENYWLPLKNIIFKSESKDIPDLMFNSSFELIVQRGGILFSKEEYSALQNCMRIAGDTYFVLIENKFTRNTEADFPHLRFKFPIETTWEELNNGDENFPDISFETIFIMNKHFFVFGDSGKWGKYAASDYKYTPLDIIGFKTELATIFHKNFKQPKKEQEEVWKWLPQEYKKLIK